MNYTDWIHRVDQGNPGTFLLCAVREPYLWDTMKKVLQSDVLNGQRLSFNYAKLDGERITSKDFITSMETLPLLSECRVVVLEHAPFRKEDIKRQEALLQAIAEQVLSHPTHVMLVCAFEGEKPFRGKIFQSMEREWERIDLARLSDRQLLQFIEKHFHRRGINLEKGVSALLARMSEYGDRQSAKTLYDVENLVAATAGVAKEGRLSVASAESVLISPEDRNIFSLMDAILERKSEEAIVLTHGFRSLGEDPYRLFYMLVREIRNMIGVKRAVARNLSPRDGQSRLQLSSYEYQKIAKGVSQYQFSELLTAHERLFSMERRMKTGSLDLMGEMERFVLRLLRR